MKKTNDERLKEFNKEYYDQFLSHTRKDMNRPIRKALRRGMVFLPQDPSLVVFAFGTHKSLTGHEKIFKEIYGYEINPVSIQEAEKNGYKGMVFLQNCAEVFTPKVPICTVAISEYICEHLPDDEMVENLLINKTNHALINVTVLTNKDDPLYQGDPTHCNPKSGREWSQLIGAFYKKRKWTRLWSNMGRQWCYAHPMISNIFKDTDKAVAETLRIQMHRVSALTNAMRKEHAG